MKKIKPPRLYRDKMQTLNTLHMPRVSRLITNLVLGAFIFVVLFLLFVPWVQTSPGLGKITVLDPQKRLQTINALVSGRIGDWYVQDGSKVKKGDPIVEVMDNDMRIVERLTSERDANLQKLKALETAEKTALLDYERQLKLFNEGLAARKTYEEAKIKLEEMRSKVAAAQAELTKAETGLSRQVTQTVRAPQDGTIIHIHAGDAATFIKAGDVLATFLPDGGQMVAEVYVDGLDAPLIYPGRQARLIFEGWPAVQFSGWPSVAVGTFRGEVLTVDPALSPNGRVRVLIKPDPENPWPSGYFLRFGARVQSWVLLDTVSVGYEMWRKINNFPPEFSAKIAGEAMRHLSTEKEQ